MMPRITVLKHRNYFVLLFWAIFRAKAIAKSK